MCCKKVKIIFLVGNPHHLLWFLLLIIKHQQWQPNNFINKPSLYWVLLTDDRRIAGSWNLVLNSSMMKYFKNTQNVSTRPLCFMYGVYRRIISGFYVIISPVHFSSLSSSLSCDFIPCSGCSDLHRVKIKCKKYFLSLAKLSKCAWHF